MTTSKGKVKKEDNFVKVMTTPIQDIYWILQRLVSTMRRLNREEKLNDEEFWMLHQDIDLVFRPSLSPSPTSKGRRTGKK